MSLGLLAVLTVLVIYVAAAIAAVSLIRGATRRRGRQIVCARCDYAIEGREALLHLLQRDLPGTGELFLVGGGPAADNVANAGEQVLEDVGAKDRFAGDDAEVSGDSLAFESRRGRDLHINLLR